MEIRSEKENVLYYTDGHAVTVTDTVLQVKKKWYSLNGITHHGFLIIPPFRLPGILLMALGTALMAAGIGGLIPVKSISEVELFDWVLNANDYAVAAGVLLLIPGIIAMVLMRERYAVSITTAEGEKKVVVSNRKEYVSQIVNALNEAFFARISPGGEDTHRKFNVSGR